jgi:hypothetical protein
LKSVKVYKVEPDAVSFDQLPMKRDWMDLTFDRHAYHCFPMSLANRLGWTISFPEDIVFIWNGINNSLDSNVKILKGSKYAHSYRGNSTISFNSRIIFDSKENLTLLTMPVPNQFIAGAQCITTVTSTSVLGVDFPVAWMVTSPNQEITIPANTPIAAIVPISLTDIQDHEVTLIDGPPSYPDSHWPYIKDRERVSQEMNQSGTWTHFYRDAVDHLGQPVGQHESKKIVLKVKNEKNH